MTSKLGSPAGIIKAVCNVFPVRSPQKDRHYRQSDTQPFHGHSYKVEADLPRC